MAATKPRASVERRQELLLTRLRNDVPSLGDDIVQAVKAEVPTYGEHGRLSPDDAAGAQAADALATIIGMLESKSAPAPEGLQPIIDVAECQLGAGVPSEQVVSALRVSQRVFLEAVLHEGAQAGTPHSVLLSLTLSTSAYADAVAQRITERHLRRGSDGTSELRRTSSEAVGALSEGRLPPEPTVAALANRFPFGSGQRYLGVHIVEGPKCEHEELRRHLVLLGASSPFEGAVTRLNEDEIEVVLAVSEHGSTLAQARLAALLHGVTDRLRLMPRIGIGGLAEGVSEVPASLAEARAASRRALPGRTLALGELSVVERATLMMDGRSSPQRIVEGSVRAFIAEDLARGGTLTRTAVAYVDCDLNARRTAERMYVHANTVRYRLGRIESHTGVDVRSPAQLFEFVSAVRIVQAAWAEERDAPQPMAQSENQPA